MFGICFRFFKKYAYFRIFPGFPGFPGFAFNSFRVGGMWGGRGCLGMTPFPSTHYMIFHRDVDQPRSHPHHGVHQIFTVAPTCQRAMRRVGTAPAGPLCLRDRGEPGPPAAGAAIMMHARHARPLTQPAIGADRCYKNAESGSDSGFAFRPAITDMTTAASHVFAPMLL